MMKICHILLVEDDLDDIELFQEAMRENGPEHKVDVIMQGDRVLPYLEKKGQQPDVIVLDLNLPKMPGKEILKLLKSSPEFARIRVIILTTSNTKMDVEDCLDLGAEKFITKPVNTEGFREMAKTIADSSCI
jgi:CheY-like chemotaxis protein